MGSLNRYVTWILGGLMGIATGALVAHPLAAMMGPTTVTWDASSCPAGVYLVKTSARNAQTMREFTFTSSKVALPRPTFSQDLDLPQGTYAVSAVALTANGRTFRSAEQTVTGLGPPVSEADGASTIIPPHRRTTTGTTGMTRTRAGVWGVRTPAATAPTAPPTDLPKDPAWSTPSSVVSIAPERALPRLLQQVLAALEASEAGGGQGWRSLEAIDTDADGVFDALRIDLADGDILIWQFDH